jgi:hypothetical protein
MLEKYEICLGLFHGFELSPLTQETAQQRISMIPAGQEFILAQERGKERVEETLRAANLAPEAEEAPGTYFARHSPGGEPGDKRVGVVWHTQGSGKSLTMAFYAGRLILHPAMENPTIVVITDRNDLDGPRH